MTTQFLLTVTGPFRAGLIGELAERTIARGGTWRINKSIHVEGQFAAILKVEAPAEQCDALRAELGDLPGYRVEFADAAPEGAARPEAVSVSFRARDRSGLTRDIHRVFDDSGIVADNLDVHRLAVGGIGESVFTCSASALVPDGLDLDALRAELEAIEPGAIVEIGGEGASA